MGVQRISVEEIPGGTLNTQASKRVLQQNHEKNVKKKPEEQSGKSSEELRKEAESAKQLSKTLDKIVTTFNTDIRIRFDEHWDGPVVQIIDTRTQDVIRQIPPDELIRVAERIHRFLGIMLDLEA